MDLNQPSRLVITDLATNINQLAGLVASKGSAQSDTPCGRCLSGFSILNPSVWVILTLLGVITALLGFIMDFVGERLLEARGAFAFASIGPQSLFIWVGYSLAFAFVAACVGRWISVDAEGSGIPEMKAILSGLKMPKYLSLQTLAGKVIGLISAYAAGLSIGREGPFVHIAGIVAHRLCKLNCFRHVYVVLFT